MSTSTDSAHLKQLREAAERGSPDDQFNLGQLYERGTTTMPKDLGEAIKWYTTAASNGEARAAYILAAMYFDGKGVKRNYVEAAKWYRKLADEGWRGPAQARLGWMCENGKGVLQDIVEAHKWFNLAVESMPLSVGMDDKTLEKAGAEASSGRSRVEAAMTPAQIKEAWQRYETWKNALRDRTGA